MIAAPRFVFLHLHKSGGTFVNECLLRHVPGARQVGYHLPRALVPAECASLPVLGLVRNPWDYYVSWYAFQRGLPRQNALFRIVSDEGRLDFVATVRNLVLLGDDPARLDAAVAALPATYGRQGLNLPGPALRAFAGAGIGFYSFLFRHIHGADPHDVHFGRCETLRADLPQLLERVGEPVSPALREHLTTAPPTNVSRHGPAREYYDAPLRDLVAARDGGLIERFDYRFSA